MKFLNAVIFLMATGTAFAAHNVIEFDHELEVKCAQEALRLNCKGTDVQITNCKESKKAELTLECRSMHEAQVRN